MKNSALNKLAIEIISALLTLLFVYTALSKFREFDLFKAFLSQAPFFGPQHVILAWSLPLIELLISLFLFFPITRVLGLYCSVFLIILFTLYLAYMVAFIPDKPCNCGGVIKTMTWPQHFIFNIVLTIISGLGIALTRRNRLEAEKPEKKSRPFFHT